MSLSDDRVPGGSVGKRVNLGGTIDSNGNPAGLVIQADGAGIGVVGSIYDGDKATSTTSKREAIPTGATSVWVCNESVATTESVRFRFGDSTVVATATTGFRLSPGITTAAGDNGPKYLSVPVPGGASDWAYISEAGTPTINVVWGG